MSGYHIDEIMYQQILTHVKNGDNSIAIEMLESLADDNYIGYSSKTIKEDEATQDRKFRKKIEFAIEQDEKYLKTFK